MNRSIQAEGVFGVLKQDYGFRRFLCRGNNNIRTEFLLLLYLLTVLPKCGKDPTEAQLKSVMPWNMALPAYCRKMYKEVQ